MKQLILILVGATAVFMALSMAQEPETFAPLFTSPAEAPAAAEEVPAEVVSALSEFNAVLEHYYRFGGDSRFLDRLSASETVKDELRAEIDYLGSNGVMQTLEKTRGSILASDRIAPGVWQLHTEEVWLLQYHDGSGTPINPEKMETTVTLRYVISVNGDRPTIEVMEPAAP